MVSWKIVSVLTKFRESSPGKFDLFLQYFLKILCVPTKFWTRSPGKFDLFLRYFFLLKSCVFLQNFEKALLEILMCSSIFCLSWKICVLVPFLVLLENLMCSYKRIMSSPGKFQVFLLHPSVLENLMCSRNLFKKVTPGKKNRYFSKIAPRLLLLFVFTLFINQKNQLQISNCSYIKEIFFRIIQRVYIV